MPVSDRCEVYMEKVNFASLMAIKTSRSLFSNCVIGAGNGLWISIDKEVTVI